jgi:hypothetical protein
MAAPGVAVGSGVSMGEILGGMAGGVAVKRRVDRVSLGSDRR